MTNDSKVQDQSLPLAVLEWMDRVCLEFEAAWTAGQSPRIESMLGDAREPGRSALLRELLLLELDYQSHSGQTLSLEDYQTRFPDHSDLVFEVFRQHQTAETYAEPDRKEKMPRKKITLDEFIQSLGDCGLMSADEVQAFLDGLPQEDKPTQARDLAKEMVRQKKLTAYQAQQIYARLGKSLVLGNYVILDKLGQGGMGLVLKAEHRRMKRLVALKVLSPKVIKSPEALRRFQREVEAAARLEHANIVTAHDADDSAGTHFLVMQFVDGSDLSSVVRKSGPLPVDQALDCILQAARGLQYAHEHGVVHRDIKPANLLLDRQGAIKILDMGLARLDTAGAQQDQLTGTGEIMGTVDYMAPEQALDSKRADARADIYSLGVTLWYLLTGRPLYTGETVIKKLKAHQTKPIPSLRDACPEVPPTLDAVFHRMVAKTPLDRYQTMAEVIAELEPFCGPAASGPARSPSTVADSQRDAFLRGLGPSAESRRARRRTSSQPAPVVVKTKAALATAPAVANPDVTLDWSEPHLDTATRSMALQSRAPQNVRSPAARLRRAMLRGDWWRDWRWLAAGAGSLLVVLLGIWVVVRDKDGKEIARIQVPEGATVTQEPIPPLPVPGLEKPEHRPMPAVSEPQPLPPWNLPAGSPAPAVAPFDAAQAKQHQEAWAEHLGVPVEFENSIGMKFVLIPPGEFDMGSTEQEVAALLEEARATNKPDWYIERLLSETPMHRVRSTKAFWLGRCEVTRGQFRRFVDDSGYQTEAEQDGRGGSGLVDGQWKQDPRFVWNEDWGFEQTDDHPVQNVSWNDATAFCEWLSEKEGETYHLPSQAQWEYACRAGTTTRWYGTDDVAVLQKHAWFVASGGGTIHLVGQRLANAWGLFDMHGNVWEWCMDYDWDEQYCANSPLNDPTGPDEGSVRVFRGGSKGENDRCCRSASRSWDWPSHGRSGLGFRLARTVSSSP